MAESDTEREDKAQALAYARGRREQEVDSRLDSHERRLSAINGNIARYAQAQEATANTLRKAQEETASTLRGLAAKIEQNEAVAKALSKASVSRREFWLGVASIVAILLGAIGSLGGIHP